MMRQNPRLCALLLSVAACVTVASAQSRPGTPASPQQPPPLTVAERAPLLTLSFPGWTVGEYVEHIHEALERDDMAANIILKDGVENVPVPAVDLQSVSVEGALTLLHHHQAAIPNGTARVDLDRIHASGLPIYILAAEQFPKSPTAQEEVFVWNVSEMLSSDIKADDILTAIESALSLVRTQHEPDEVRFHEATGLVMARGVKEQLGTIDKVVSQLRETAHSNSAVRQHQMEMERAHRAMKEAEARQQDLEGLRAALTMTEHEREALRREIETLQQRHEMEIRERQKKQMEDRDTFERTMRENQQRIHELEQRLQERRGDGE